MNQNVLERLLNRERMCWSRCRLDKWTLGPGLSQLAGITPRASSSTLPPLTQENISGKFPPTLSWPFPRHIANIFRDATSAKKLTDYLACSASPHSVDVSGRAGVSGPP